MGEWKTCTIADIGTVVGGATPSTKKRKTTLMAILLGLRQKIYQTIVADILQKVKEI